MYLTNRDRTWEVPNFFLWGQRSQSFGDWYFRRRAGVPRHCGPFFPSHGPGSGRTFICSRQVGTAMRLMLSEEVLMSTLQSRSTRRGRETVKETGQLRAPAAHLTKPLLWDRQPGGLVMLLSHRTSLRGRRSQGPSSPRSMPPALGTDSWWAHGQASACTHGPPDAGTK